VAAGGYLTAVAGWQLLVVGIASILAGVLYTGGPRPYGYEGLGELFVFLFFGVVAVVGSYYVQTEDLRWEAFAHSVPVGLLAAAILVVNNLRDIDTDRATGKYTLAVLIGRRGARIEYVLLLAVAFAVPVARWLMGASLWAWLPWLTLPFAIQVTRVVLRQEGRPLNPALRDTARLHLSFGILLALSLLL
jgi:1,4-dihydroxy-2-naphthoate octaprenyltransferase